ncbi:hypothetical protein ACYF6T_32205 [Streptomyces sp. 7R007]
MRRVTPVPPPVVGGLPAGTRAATDGEDGDLVLALWDQAEADGRLTAPGEEFGPDVRALEAAMSTVGYGDLSGRGKEVPSSRAAGLRPGVGGNNQRTRAT